MDINNIKEKYEELSSSLKRALARMERSDQVFVIKESIKELQHLCPHDNGSFDFTTTPYCPYCGKKFKE